MSIINLLIIGYTLSILYVFKDFIVGVARLYCFKVNIAFDPNDLKGIERVRFIAEGNVPITYLAAILNSLFRIIGYTLGFGALYFIVSFF